MPQIPPFGKFATFGIGLQTVAGTPVVPTLWTRKTALSKFSPEVKKFRSKAAFGVLDGQQSEIALRTAEFSSEFELTTGVAMLILQHMLGAAPSAGVITPVHTDFGTLMPLQPLTIESGNPGEFYKFSDVQITKFGIAWNSDGYMIGKIDAKALTVADLGSLTTPVIPTGAFSRSHLNINLGGVTPFLSEKFDLELTVPVDFVEATTGTVLPAGFARGNGDETFRELTISMSRHEVNAASKAKYETNGTDTLVARMVNGANILEFNLGAFEYIDRGFSNNNARVVTDIMGRAVPSGGNLFLAKNV